MQESRTEKRVVRKKVESYLESDNDSYDNIEQPEITLEEVPRTVLVPNKHRGYPAKVAPTPGNDKKTAEVELYGKLLSEKLMKLNEEDRLQLMNAIDNLVYRTTRSALARDKAYSTPAPSSSLLSLEDPPKENYIIQVMKSSPKAAADDPLND